MVILDPLPDVDWNELETDEPVVVVQAGAPVATGSPIPLTAPAPSPSQIVSSYPKIITGLFAAGLVVILLRR
jgi:hypothetical protein